MALDLLDAPLRLTWDICSLDAGGLDPRELLLIADRLVEAGVFSLILDRQPLGHPGLDALLERLQDGGCQVSLVIGHTKAEHDALATVDTSFPLLVNAVPWLQRQNGLAGLEAFIRKLQQNGRRPSLLWIPQSGQLRSLWPLLDICRRLTLPCFKLPNAPIGANSEPPHVVELLQKEDLQELSRLLDETPLLTKDVSLEIHDLFLWELLFPQGGGARSEYGGCQAGNSLGHITSAGDLWPCSSWPQPLGSLLVTDLETLWQSRARFGIREEVAVAPSDCAGCRDYSRCYGGCRGLALACRTDGEKRDLLCAGPRK